MGLALVVLEEHPGRAMELGDDNPLGAVDHEGPVGRHQGDLAEVNFLLLDVLDRTMAALDVPNHELNLDLDRRGEGHAALMALVDVVFRGPQFVADEFQRGVLIEVLDRENRLENPLQTDIATLLGAGIGLEKFVVGALLNLDQIGNINDFLDFAERAAKTKVGCNLRLLSHCYSAR